jgi:hypothetical protein
MRASGLAANTKCFGKGATLKVAEKLADAGIIVEERRFNAAYVI